MRGSRTRPQARRLGPGALLAAALLATAGCGPSEGEPTPEPCAEASGVVCTFAGTGLAGYDGGGLDRRESLLYFPIDIELSPYGKPVIADWNNHKLRQVEDDGTLTTIMGTDFVGDGPVDQSDLTVEGAPGTTVNLNHPTEQEYYPDGVLLSASWHTHKLRTWDPATGLVRVVLGRGAGFVGDDLAPDDDVLMNQPKSVAIDDDFNVYIVDMRNERVRLWTADGRIVTVAGTGTQGFSGDHGPGHEAMVAFPKGENPEPGGTVELSEDQRTLYIADTLNHRIRALDLATGIISTVVGTGEAGDGGDGGPAVDAQLYEPRDLEIQGGRMIIADTGNHKIRVVDLATGLMSTLAGDGEAAFQGDGGPATEASFNRPFGVGVDVNGDIYVCDRESHRIRVIYD